MSRSRKKPYFTDNGACKKVHKKLANKRVRATDDVCNGTAYKSEYESWNIQDYSFHCPDNPKAKRK